MIRTDYRWLNAENSILQAWSDFLVIPGHIKLITIKETHTHTSWGMKENATKLGYMIYFYEELRCSITNTDYVLGTLSLSSLTCLNTASHRSFDVECFCSSFSKSCLNGSSGIKLRNFCIVAAVPNISCSSTHILTNCFSIISFARLCKTENLQLDIKSNFDRNKIEKS